MPSFKTHLVGGIIFYSFILFFIPTPFASLMTKGEWLLFTLAGSLFPDIDIKSKGQKFFYLILLCLTLFLCAQQYLRAVVGCAIVACLPVLVKHRGIFHSLWFIMGLNGAVLGVIACYYPLYIKIALYDSGFFMLGAFSHILLDKGCRRMLGRKF
jgi:membrane-bound metal-dependent hydrolase YbcI (DUF457 family)